MHGLNTARRRVLYLAMSWWAGSQAAWAQRSPPHPDVPPMPDPQARALRLGTNQHAITQLVAAQLLRDICARAGFPLQLEPLPGRRATLMAVDGSIDGEVARISPYAAANPPLVRVDPPYYALTTSIFVRKGYPTMIRTLDDLATQHAGVVGGEVHAEMAAKHARSVVDVGTYDQLYKLLDAGRIDVAIDTGLSGDAEIRRLRFESRLERQGDVARYDLHVILGPRRASLAPLLGNVIRALRDSGELARLTREYERQVVELWIAQA